MKKALGVLTIMSSIITIYQFAVEQFLNDIWVHIFIALSGFLLGAFLFKRENDVNRISYIGRLHISRFVLAVVFIFVPLLLNVYIGIANWDYYVSYQNGSGVAFFIFLSFFALAIIYLVLYGVFLLFDSFLTDYYNAKNQFQNEHVNDNTYTKKFDI